MSKRTELKRKEYWERRMRSEGKKKCPRCEKYAPESDFKGGICSRCAAEEDAEQDAEQDAASAAAQAEAKWDEQQRAEEEERQREEYSEPPPEDYQG